MATFYSKMKEFASKREQIHYFQCSSLFRKDLVCSEANKKSQKLSPL